MGEKIKKYIIVRSVDFHFTRNLKSKQGSAETSGCKLLNLEA